MGPDSINCPDISILELLQDHGFDWMNKVSRLSYILIFSPKSSAFSARENEGGKVGFLALPGGERDAVACHRR